MKIIWKNLPYFTPFKFTLPKPWYKRGELTEVWLYQLEVPSPDVQKRLKVER